MPNDNITRAASAERGGFETRPYKSPDFVRWLAKGVLWKPAESRLLPSHFEAAA